MISPYVRRRRFAAEVIRLREEHGWSAERLAKKIGVARQRISRLENGHIRPDLDETMKILEVFNVGERRWTRIMTIAREAQERGWWESYAAEMGTRQSLYANLEAGARVIREYQQSLRPCTPTESSFRPRPPRRGPRIRSANIRPGSCCRGTFQTPACAATSGWSRLRGCHR